MKKRHTFRINAPNAQQVMLAGDFTEWKESPVSMKRKKNGEWSATVHLHPGTYKYRFIVDDQWTDDPACSVNVPNPFGGQDAVVEIAGHNKWAAAGNP